MTPRLLRRADAAKRRSRRRSVHWEGIDNDGDGFINEDGPGGVDLNRNFQHQYPYYTPDAGPHMVSEPETRGMLDYVLARRNIAAILTFGESDNLIAPPTAAGRTGGGVDRGPHRLRQRQHRRRARRPGASRRRRASAAAAASVAVVAAAARRQRRPADAAAAAA